MNNWERMEVSIAEAKKRLRELIRAVECGGHPRKWPILRSVDLTAVERKRLRQIAVPRKTSAKKKATTFGEDLMEGLNLVLAHQRGKIELEQVWPKPIDVKAIRKRVKMSQAEFARAYGISKRALQEWEQGGRQPDSAARAYLTVITKRPAIVRRALASG